MTLTLLFISVCFLAYANGANDNFKGVASLYGSGAASYRTSLVWATIATFAGSVCALYWAQTL
ncbi:MAG: inorganic phosphate transporter, partial [Methylosarcina sp.]